MSFLVRLSRSGVASSAWKQRGAAASMSTSSSSTATDPEPKVYPVYVHHLSKIVLQHLQSNRSDWIVEQGLDRGLRLNSDGTFVLRFPSNKGQADGGRIWTSYDGTKKQHWLSVYRQRLVGRFLLKDSVAHRDSTESVDGSVRCVVDQMVRTLSELENPQQTPSS